MSANARSHQTLSRTSGAHADQVLGRLSAPPDLREQNEGYYARATIWAVSAGLVAFCIWAWITPVYEVVSGSGAIQPGGLATRVEHIDGGTVTGVHIREGHRVYQGQILVTLDDTSLKAELAKLTTKRENIRRDIARFRTLLSLDFSLPQANEAGALLENGTSAFAEETRYRLMQVATSRAERAVSRARGAALIAQRSKMREELELLQKQTTRYATIRDKEVVPLRQIEEMERTVMQLQGQLAKLDGDIEVLASTTAQLFSQEEQLIAGFRREAALALEEKMVELEAADQSIMQIKNRLDHTKIRSPIAGIINDLMIENVGEVVAPGEVTAEIIPEGDSVFAEVDVPADQIGGVSVGQTANLKVLTYDFTRFGDVQAVVDRISPSSVLNPEGEAVFRVQLQLTSNVLSLNRNGSMDSNRHRILPGMTVVADIKSARRTVWSYLLKPMRVIADRAFTEA